MTPVSWTRNLDVWNVLGKFHPDDMNRQEGSLSRSWRPLIYILKEHDKVLCKEK
jgi:hypothetical protein